MAFMVEGQMAREMFEVIGPDLKQACGASSRLRIREKGDVECTYVAVALTAVVADRNPSIRVCMWTCPIVFLTGDPGMPLLTTSLHRGAEVLIGAVIGATLHLMARWVLKESAR